MADRSVSLKESAKLTMPALKPSVLMLAMLLPMTSMSCWKLSSPLTADESEFNIIYFLFSLRFELVLAVVVAPGLKPAARWR